MLHAQPRIKLNSPSASAFLLSLTCLSTPVTAARVPMSVAFWSVLQSTPTRLSPPPPAFLDRQGPGVNPSVSLQKLVAACTPSLPPCQATTIITVSFHFLGAEQPRSGPAMSEKSGPQRRVRTWSGPGREVAFGCSAIPESTHTTHTLTLPLWAFKPSDCIMPLGPLGPLDPLDHLANLCYRT